LRSQGPCLRGDVHHVSVGGRRFVLDVGTSSAFEVNEIGAEAVKALSTLPRSRATSAHTAYSGDVWAQAVGEVEALLARGFFQPERAPPPVTRLTSQSWDLMLGITRRCTLRCAYCTRGNADRHGAPMDMSPEVIDASLDWAANEWAKGGRRITVVTGAIGESLLYPEGCDRVADSARRLTAATGKAITASEFNTNLTLAQRPEVWERLLNGWWNLSIDGPPEAHDAMRTFPDGTGSHSLIGPHAARLACEGTCRAFAVVTGQYTDLTSVFLHLCDLGFREIVLRPVVADAGQPFRISGANLAAVKGGFTDWVEFLLAQPDDMLLDYLMRIWGCADFLGRFLVRVLARHKVRYRCGAGKNTVAVDTNGDLYPCSHLIGIPECRIGTVFSGIDEALLRLYWEELDVTRKASCRQCWARYLCGGGCYALGWFVNGNVARPDPADCDLTRHMVELAVYATARLRAERPSVLAALDLPTGVRVNMGRAVACFYSDRPLTPRDAESEWESPDPLRFERADQLKGRIWGGPHDISGEMHFRWDEERLYLMVRLRGRGALSHRAGSLFGVFLVPAEEIAAISDPIWWTAGVAHHHVDYVPSSITATVTAYSVTGQVTSVEAPAHFEARQTDLCARVAIPWTALPLLRPEQDAHFGVNAVVCPPDKNRPALGMRWMTQCPIGAMRLCRPQARQCSPVPTCGRTRAGPLLPANVPQTTAAAQAGKCVPRGGLSHRPGERGDADPPNGR